MFKYQKEWDRANELNIKYNAGKGLNERDLEELLDFADVIPIGGTYVEVGVSGGFSLLAVAMFRPDVECYGVENEKRIVEKIIEEEHIKRVHFVYMDSTEACKTWDKEIDLLFIDGNHYLPQVYYDTMGWMPHVKKGCSVLYHDTQVVDEGEQYDVYKVVKVLRGHNKYKVVIPAVDENISTSISIVTKLY